MVGPLERPKRSAFPCLAHAWIDSCFSPKTQVDGGGNGTTGCSSVPKDQCVVNAFPIEIGHWEPPWRQRPTLFPLPVAGKLRLVKTVNPSNLKNSALADSPSDAVPVPLSTPLGRTFDTFHADDDEVTGACHTHTFPPPCLGSQKSLV